MKMPTDLELATEIFISPRGKHMITLPSFPFAAWGLVTLSNPTTFGITLIVSVIPILGTFFCAYLTWVDRQDKKSAFAMVVAGLLLFALPLVVVTYKIHDGQKTFEHIMANKDVIPKDVFTNMGDSIYEIDTALIKGHSFANFHFDVSRCGVNILSTRKTLFHTYLYVKTCKTYMGDEDIYRIDAVSLFMAMPKFSGSPDRNNNQDQVGFETSKPYKK